jgi:DNA-binding Lrp family transcriptional regulator
MPSDVRVFLNLFVESKELEKVTENLLKFPEVTDVFEVTGEYDVVAILSVDSIGAFREVLKNRVLKINGVKSTVSSVVLHTHKKEGRVIAPS